MKNSKRIFSLTANSKKIALMNIIAGVIIGALIIYIVGIVWFYISLWIPLHRSQEIGREVDRYIIEHGYKEEIMKVHPEMEIRNLGD
jgi:biotin transporter BioY